MWHRYFQMPPKEITELTAPKWLTSEDTIPGSTADTRWFWKDHVLTLEVGKSVNTDFWHIHRVS